MDYPPRTCKYAKEINRTTIEATKKKEIIA